ncbi:MAG: tetratricopeptide repeat protein [Phycisphaerales bacterium JB065]
MADEEPKAPQTEEAAPADASAPEEAEAKPKRSIKERIADLRAMVPKTEEPLRGGRDLWQMPTLIGGLLLLAIGLTAWVNSAPEPDFNAALDDVAKLIDEQRYDDAIAVLNDPLGKYIYTPEAKPDDVMRYYLLSADALSSAQRLKGIADPRNHESVVEYYTEARDTYLAELNGQRKYNLAESQLALKRPDEAIATVLSIGDEDVELRHRLLKRLIDRAINPADDLISRAKGIELLATLRQDPLLATDDRLWTVARQTRLRLANGNYEEAIERLLPELQAMKTRQGHEAGHLFLLLGRAYYEMGLMEAAEGHLQRATSMLNVSDPLFGEAEVVLGRVAQVNGDVDIARDRFAGAAERFPQPSVAAEAYLGLAEIQAVQTQLDEALMAYDRAIELVLRDPLQATITAEQIEESVEQHFSRLDTEGDFANALRFALRIERLHENQAPPSAVARIAYAHQKLAASLLEGVETTVDGLPDFASVDPVTLEQARSNYYRAAMEFRRHARMMTLIDPDASALSLWEAAVCFDLAGDQDRARGAFTEYVQTRTGGDPRWVEAKYRLARTNQARGEYDSAIELYEDILANHATTEMAYTSYVPLAQCYMLRGGERAVEQAESRLRAVVEGRVLSPDAPEYRDALVELGLLYRRTGRYEESIERLTAAIDLEPRLSEDLRVLLALADASRLSAADITDALQVRLPQSETDRLLRLKEARLGEALDLYDSVHAMIDSGDPSRRSELDKVRLRNAMLYRGDCAFDLAKHHENDSFLSERYYTEAIRHYAAAAQRYPNDPSSLVAMVQIVNCHAAMGRWQEARTAHERARARLAELPEQAFERGEVPMSRAHWENWLSTSIQLDQRSSAESAR